MTALKEKYRSEIVPKLQSDLGLKNVMAVPRISKITLNMGVGEAVGDKKVLEHAVADMEKIAGQKPIVTKSRKSIAGFKIRDGWPIGCKVTLRDERMYEFLDRLINIAIPRVRDFRGISPKHFDGRGNFCSALWASQRSSSLVLTLAITSLSWARLAANLATVRARLASRAIMDFLAISLTP